MSPLTTNPITHPRFVVQRHAARTLHFDFRLEKDGVFKSWAVPKGLPEALGVKRLAIRVEDHNLDFGNFEGVIPDGEYGAGEIEVWDRGTYESDEWLDDRIAFHLHGQRLQGPYNLIRFLHGGENAWLLFRRSGD